MPKGIPKNGINKGWFEKGIHPKTEFKKGHKSWNKDKKLHYNVWNKGTQQPKGKNAMHWQGGKTKSNGYIYIYKPEHPFTTHHNYVRRSRLIAEKCLKRYLTETEIIHHIGEKYPMNSSKNKSDDRPENLYLFENQSKHITYHLLKKPKLKSNLLNCSRSAEFSH